MRVLLHNVCLDADNIPADVNLEAELNEERLMQPDHHQIIHIDNERNNIAQGKRINIANMLYVRHQ